MQQAALGNVLASGAWTIALPGTLIVFLSSCFSFSVIPGLIQTDVFFVSKANYGRAWESFQGWG